jgi:GTP-binding protein Era
MEQTSDTNAFSPNLAAFRSGFVAFVGRPNVGKSTLINTIIGKKIAITSPTAQTTRHRFHAVLTKSDFQMIIVDTPGLHKPQDILGEELNTSALKALKDVDVVCFFVDATQKVGRGDAWVAAHVAKTSAKKVLVMNKSDAVSHQQISEQLDDALKLGSAKEQGGLPLPGDHKIGESRGGGDSQSLFDDAFVLSAQTGEGVQNFVETVASYLPKGPLWFPQNMLTDQPLEVIVSEFIREKILRNFTDEIPHAIGVETAEMQYKQAKQMYSIYATIFVERESQKGMIIGKGGAAIKRTGIESRENLEHMLGTKVFLDLKVKVKKNWRKDLNQIRRFGYGEGI